MSIRFWPRGTAAFALCATLALPAAAQNVRLATSMGDIVVELDAAKAPKTVDNFLQYVKAGHYNGTIFHRVIEGFMIQGGGMTADMKEKPTRAPIPLESRNGLRNARGTVAMARTMDPNSATAQFFINLTARRQRLRRVRPRRAGHGRGRQDQVRPDGQQGAPPERAGTAGDHQAGHIGEMT